MRQAFAVHFQIAVTRLGEAAEVERFHLHRRVARLDAGRQRNPLQLQVGCPAAFPGPELGRRSGGKMVCARKAGLALRPDRVKGRGQRVVHEDHRQIEGDPALVQIGPHALEQERPAVHHRPEQLLLGVQLATARDIDRGGDVEIGILGFVQVRRRFGQDLHGRERKLQRQVDRAVRACHLCRAVGPDLFADHDEHALAQIGRVACDVFRSAGRRCPTSRHCGTCVPSP